MEALSQAHWLSMRTIFGDPDAAMPAGPSREADEEYARGVALLESGEPVAAEQALLHADELGHAGAPRELAQWAMGRNDLARWSKLLWQARERGDGRAAALIGVGMAKDPEQAERAQELFRFADEAGDCEGARNLGLALAEMGNLDGAEQALHRSDQRGSASGSLALGLFLRDRRGDLEAAESAFVRAYERGHPKGSLHLVDVYAERGDLAAAQGAAKMTLALASRNATLFGEMLEPEFERYLAAKARPVPSAGGQATSATGSGCLVSAAAVALFGVGLTVALLL